MVTANDIMVGVVFTGERHANFHPFFRSCIHNDFIDMTRDLSFVVVDNGCSYDVQGLCAAWLPQHEHYFVYNELTESLSYNLNQIAAVFLNSSKKYLIHTTESTYFRDGWMTRFLWWLNQADNADKVAHFSYTTKGYSKQTLEKLGWFNTDIHGKLGTNADFEWRELISETGTGVSEGFKDLRDKSLQSRVLGGYLQRSKVLGDFLQRSFFDVFKGEATYSSFVANPEKFDDKNCFYCMAHADPQELPDLSRKWTCRVCKTVNDRDANQLMQSAKDVEGLNLSEYNRYAGSQDFWELIGSQSGPITSIPQMPEKTVRCNF